MSAVAIAPSSAETYRFPLTGEGVRVTTINGEPWFVGKDAAGILGYANTRKAVKDHVPAGHRRGNESFLLSDLGLQAQTVLIDEAGLYRLILRANTERAEPFREWVTAEVLPAIRKTGSYGAAAPQPAAPDLRSPEGVLELANAYQAAAVQLVSAQKRVAELEPAAEAWDTLASAEGDYSLRDAAHCLNRDPAISTGQNRLMAFLRDEGLVDRKGIPYVRYSRWLVERPVSYQHPHSGQEMLAHQIRITAAGLAHLRHRLGGKAA